MRRTALEKLARKRRLRVAGLMSGTSADGVSVAIADITLSSTRLLAFKTFPHAAKLRGQIFALFRPETARVEDLCHLNFALGEVFASALERLSAQSGIALSSIDLVGSHGQTVRHSPEPKSFGRRKTRSTLQIGEPCVIAERTGITTVADFRPRDIAAGGQGAPLVSYADFILFSDERKNRAIQNIGGIANVTFLRRGGKPEDIVAFDTGPGNMVIDQAAALISNGKLRYDAGGRLAARGNVREELLAELMKHRFIGRRPPKTTGREEFGTQFSNALYKTARKRGIPALDILATVTAFTARSIAKAYRSFLPAPVDEVILCGGGAKNRTLVRRIARELPLSKVMKMDDFGIDADAKEALSFAILASRTIWGIANNAPSATGARKAVVLGKVVPGRC